MTHQEACDFVWPFGKYKGKTLWEILEQDPKYMDWMAGCSWYNETLDALTIFLKHPDVQRRIDAGVEDYADDSWAEECGLRIV